MKIMSGFRVAATVLTVVAGSAILGTNPSFASDDAEFTLVTDLDSFKSHFVGPKIMDVEDSANYFVVKDGGTIEGSWYGKEMAGEWRWEDKYFCRSLSAPRAAPEDCQEWGYAEGKARLVRNRGTGDTTIYSLGE